MNAGGDVTWGRGGSLFSLWTGGEDGEKMGKLVKKRKARGQLLKQFQTSFESWYGLHVPLDPLSLANFRGFVVSDGKEKNPDEHDLTNLVLSRSQSYCCRHSLSHSHLRLLRRHLLWTPLTSLSPSQILPCRPFQTWRATQGNWIGDVAVRRNSQKTHSRNG